MVRGWMVPNFRCADIRLVRRKIGPVAGVGVVGEIVVDELLPLAQRRLLTCGQLEFDSGIGDFDSALDVGRVDPAAPISGPTSRAPASRAFCHAP